MKKILLNASQKEEVRLAVVENNRLIDLDIDFPSKNIKSNIYKGVISRVEPSLEAAFINFGRKRHGGSCLLRKYLLKYSQIQINPQETAWKLAKRLLFKLTKKNVEPRELH